MQAVVDNLLTNYNRSGKGKVVVVLHGWGDDSRSWKNFAAALDQKYDVLICDLPGFGGSESPKSAWGLDDYSSFVAHLLNKLGIKKVYAVIGHSNGGAIAIRGVARGVLKPEKMILIASAGIRGEYKGRVKALRMMTKAGKLLAAPLPKSLKQKVRRQVYSSVGSDMLVAEHLQETFKKIITDDVRNDASSLVVPTLLLYGEDDDQAPLAYGQTFTQLIKRSTLKTFPNSGHFLQIERPTEIIKAVMDFLA